MHHHDLIPETFELYLQCNGSAQNFIFYTEHSKIPIVYFPDPAVRNAGGISIALTDWALDGILILPGLTRGALDTPSC